MEPGRPYDPSPFRQVDSLGRQVPRRLGVETYLLMFARMAPERVRRIPSTAILEEGEDEQGRYALVRCPCGGHPTVRARLQQCDGCGRFYVSLALGAVWVAYGDMPVPPLPKPN